MSDFSYLQDRVAAQKIAERVQATERSRMVPIRRHARRHALANGLHSLANRLDT